MIGMKHEVGNNNMNIAQARSWNNKVSRKSSPLGKASAKNSSGPSIKSFFAPKKASGQ